MKKIVVLLMLFFFTGCSAEYNLKITEDDYLETTAILEKQKTNWAKLAYDDKNYDEAISFFTTYPIATHFQSVDFNYLNVEVTYPIYEVKKVSDKDKLGMTLKNTFKEDINKSTLMHTCYDNIMATTTSNKTYLSTSKSNKCFDMFPLLDNVTVNIQSEFLVIGSNADSVDKATNTHTWNIQKSQEDNKPIYLSIDRNKPFKAKMTFMRLLKDYPLLIIGVTILIVTTIIMTIRSIKIKKNNDL